MKNQAGVRYVKFHHDRDDLEGHASTVFSATANEKRAPARRNYAIYEEIGGITVGVQWTETQMIHDKIRRLRKTKKLRIKDVAEKTGLSVSLLSQIERGKTSPSITTLRKIAMALDVSMVYFFEGGQSNDMIVRKNERKYLARAGSNIRYQLLSPDLNRKIELVLIELDPGPNEPENLFYSHDGEECIYVSSGRLNFELDGVSHILEEGDTIYFHASKPHRIANAWDKPTVIICAVTPPSF